MLEIDIDIGWLAPFGRNETLKQQIGQGRVNIGDADAITDRGIGSRSPALTQNAF